MNRIERNAPNRAPATEERRGDDRSQEFHAARHREPPDLDAGEPLLRSHDMHRINRKALGLLSGMVVLLVGAVLWMFNGADARPDDTVRRRDETVVVPELPSAPPPAATPPAAQPIALEPLQSPDTSRLPPLPPAAATENAVPPVSVASPPPREPSLRERRMDSSVDRPSVAAPLDPYTQSLLAGMPTPLAAPSQEPAPEPGSAGTAAQFMDNPDALLVRGTYVRCVLETRIVTDIPGFTSCVVTEPVYSINGRHLLLPKGSKVSGRYAADAEGPRVAVVWDRITTPDGVDVRMASPGVDNLGGAGHPGDYDAHWPSRISAALMISLISDAFKYEGEIHGPRTTTVSNGVITQAPFDSNTARTMERLANQALNRSTGRPATVTINQGSVVNIYIAKDIDFSGVLGARR